MCCPACSKWDYFVSLLSRILNASDGEEKVFGWSKESFGARGTSETRTRVRLHSTPLLVHSTSSTCTSCSPPTGRRSPPRSRENSEKNSDLLPFVIWTLVCLSPSDRSSVTLRDIGRVPECCREILLARDLIVAGVEIYARKVISRDLRLQSSTLNHADGDT